ncbi:unnamed protein product [Phytophthora fragariaefolia]|uniref:Unnamed protein product n=1 Tax=Phytophthora fragariaefolia TaxID=1490495 RepID=A0A9W6Y689_9STRA|nr:unnamed protein product [Phytophthora fragariaefolia]
MFGIGFRSQLWIGQLSRYMRSDVGGETEEIQLGSDGENMGYATGCVVSIEKIGTYTREQLEEMKWIWSRSGLPLSSWRNTELKGVVKEPVATSLALDQFLNA